AQFALPGAVDRLRAEPQPDDSSRVTLLAAADPAQPYGAMLPWPRADELERMPLQRVPGAYVVLVDGAPAIYVEKGGRGLLTMPAFTDGAVASVGLAAISRLCGSGGPAEHAR